MNNMGALNEEKAKQLAEEYENTTLFGIESSYHAALGAALEMAEWKDEQYEEEKKELRGLVNMLPINENNQTIIEDLKALLS